MLGEIHWHVLKAANALEKTGYTFVKTHGEFGRSEPTELGKEVGHDEINWWVTKKEKQLEDLRERTAALLQAVQSIKKAVDALKNRTFPESYHELLETISEVVTDHTKQIELLREYVLWLEARHQLAPTILYTYRIWGSTRMSDRWMTIEAGDAITEDVKKLLAETVLGLRLRGLCTYDRMHMDVGQEIYDSMSSEEQADGTKTLEVPVGDATRRTVYETYNQCAIYFTETRDSLRNILLDIDKFCEQQALIHNLTFWREFIIKAARAKIVEPQVWDFKETLSIWHAEGAGRTTAKVEFAEDIAAFANARGGVFVVGVTDNPRRIIGVGSGKSLEHRLQFAKTVIAEHLEYDRELVTFNQIYLEPEGGAPALCLVIIVAQSCQAVGVNVGAGSFTYPIRLETGKQRSSQIDIARRKQFLKNDNFDFVSGELLQFVRDH
jgi:Putative DNA-binding domain